MEGDGGNLEAKSDQDKRRADGKEKEVEDGAYQQEHANGSSEKCPRRAEDQRNPVDDKSSRERSEQEVFQSRFFRLQVGTGKSGKHIQRNGQQFEREEDDDEVGGLGHQQHARDAEKHQRVIFAAFDAHAFEVAIGKGDAKQAAEEDEGAGEGGETVESHHAVETCALRARPV